MASCLELDSTLQRWARRGRGKAAASSELKRKIKNEIREVTVENIMKYINLGKAAQWAIKSEIGWGVASKLQPHRS